MNPNDITVVMDELGLSGESWSFWRAVLRMLFHLPLSPDETSLMLRHTGRTKLFSSALGELWLCLGRRAGKSRIISAIAVYLAAFVDYRAVLAPGELGVIVLCAPSQRQARVLLHYVSAFLCSTPMLARMIKSETDSGVELSNGISIEIFSSSFKRVRGVTVVAALVDEIAFLPLDEFSAEPDSELLYALRGAMGTIPNSLLICSSTPHAQRGELHKAHQQHFANDDSPICFLNADSLTANPALNPRVVEQAFISDAVIAASEYGENGSVSFRTDVESFLSAEVLESIVNPDLPLISEAA
jgi:hypothetical protein